MGPNTGESCYDHEFNEGRDNDHDKLVINPQITGRLLPNKPGHFQVLEPKTKIWRSSTPTAKLTESLNTQ